MLAIALVLRPGVDSSTWEAALKSAAHTLAQAGFDAATAVAVEPDAFDGTAHGAVVSERVDGVLSVPTASASSQQELAGALRATAERLAETADVRRSAVLAGVEHTVVDGDGPLHINFVLRRPATMDHAQFCDYWLNNHGQLARDAPRRRAGGYRQLHADPARSQEFATACGFGLSDYDGMVFSDHSDVERMKRAFAHPSVSEIALADERHFIDHSRSRIGLMRKLYRGVDK